MNTFGEVLAEVKAKMDLANVWGLAQVKSFMDEPVIKDRLTPGGRFIQSKHAGLLIVAAHKLTDPGSLGSGSEIPATATAYKIPDDPNDAPPEILPYVKGRIRGV